MINKTPGKISLLLLLLVTFFTSLSGQTKFDSTLVNISSLPDAKKVLVLDSLCYRFRFINEGYSLLCGEKALEISIAMKSKSLEAKTLNLIGVNYNFRMQYPKALEYFLKAQSVANEANDSTELGFAANNIAQTYNAKSYIKMALENARLALEIFTKINNRYGQAFAYTSLGDINSKAGDYRGAYANYEQAYRIRVENNDLQGKLSSLINVASALLKQGDARLGLEKCREAELEFERLEDKGNLIVIWYYMSEVYINYHDYDQALSYANKAMELCNKYGSVKGRIMQSRQLGIILSKMNRYAEADQNFLLSVQLSSSSGDLYQLLQSYNTIADVYTSRGDLSNALIYSKKAYSVKDSIILKESFEGIGEMEALAKNRKIWEATTLLKKKVEVENMGRNLILSLGLVCVLLFTLFLLLYRGQKLLIIRLNELNATKDKLFTIIAHDLKNPFHGIMGIANILVDDIKTKKYGSIYKYTEVLVDSAKRGYQLLINLLEWAQLQTGELAFTLRKINLTKAIEEAVEISLPMATTKEIQIINNSVNDIYAIADSNGLNVIFRNLIANGIKYTQPNGTITINTSFEGHKCKISVSDTGVGISEADIKKLFKIEANFSLPGTKKERGTGLGLILCKEFANKMGGDIKVSSVFGEGSTFVFEIPVLQESRAKDA